MKTSRRRLDVDVEELDRVIDAAENGPLSKADRQKLKTTLHALVERLAQKRNTEKTNSVLESKNSSSAAAESPEPELPAPTGHGRNAASAFTGAEKVSVQHAQLKPGDPCPECREGKVYRQKEPKTLIRIVGQAPLKATVFEMERLRCNACGEVFTASEPPVVGPGKVRHHRRGDDRSVEVWHWNALQPDGAVGETTRDSATGCNAMGVDGSRREADQTCAGRVYPAGGAGRCYSQRRHGHAGTETGAQQR